MICPQCSTELAGGRFCGRCGAPLVTDAVRAPAMKAPIKSDTAAVRPLCSQGEQFCENTRHFKAAWDEKLALASDVGVRHQYNEDCGAVTRIGADAVLMVVADGVSSSQTPALASRIACQQLIQVITRADSADNVLMTEAITAAHDAILALPVREDDELPGPMTAIVAAHCRDGCTTIGWVGDSRAYLISGNTACQLTRDDSWLESVTSRGLMTPTEALRSRHAHKVTQVLGQRDDAIEVHLTQLRLAHGESLLLCSDGLWNYFEQANDLANVIASLGSQVDAETVAAHLVSLSNELGGHDNVTVAFYRRQ